MTLKSLWIFAALFAAPLAPAAAQRPIDAPGTVMHRAAGAHFPERIGEFRRGDVRQYDAVGDDISATYNLVRPDGRLVITVYVYPPRLSARGSGASALRDRCGREFEAVAAQLTGQYKGADRVEEGEAPPIAGVDPALGRRAVYRFVAPFDGRAQEVRSEAILYCQVGGSWLVKYRATSNAGFDAGPAIESFIRAGPWPGRGSSETIARLPAGSSEAGR